MGCDTDQMRLKVHRQSAISDYQKCRPPTRKRTLTWQEWAVSKLTRHPWFDVGLLLFAIAGHDFVVAKEQNQQRSQLQSLLMRPVLDDGQSLDDVKEFCARRIAELRPPASWSSWQREAERIRQSVLDN